MSKDETTFDTRYKAGHIYSETWNKVGLHCPGCGVRGVWMRSGPGDYYVGEDYICTNCAHTWNLPGGTRRCDSDEVVRLGHLRAAEVV